MTSKLSNRDKLFIEADALYEQGQYMEALALFIEGTEAGDSSCMTRIALMYSSGEGVDYDKALKWELKAIELGDISAMINAGITYRIKCELVKSKYLFEQALENGRVTWSVKLNLNCYLMYLIKLAC